MTVTGTIDAELQNILDEYRDLLLAHLPGQIEQLILFGSHARGDARPDSDVDVLVVVNWPQERLPNGFYAAFSGDPRWREIINIAADISLEYSIFISPTVISEHRYNEWSPLVNQVKREGIVLWPKNVISDAEQFVAKIKELLSEKP